MACYSPLKGFKRADGGWTPSRKYSPSCEPMTVPCGKCLGCRARRRSDWAIRLVHEATLHERNCFWTVTYRDEDLPPYGSVRMADVSAAIKRLRDRVKPVRFRFMAKTEYAPLTMRPHAHGVFLGLDFEDRQLMRTTKSGKPSYVSQLFTEVWGLGHAEVSDLTLQSCAYVANHNVDKMGSGLPDSAYQRLDENGNIVELERESIRVSNRPGIGRGWADQFLSDCYPSNFVVRNGSKLPVPKYYKEMLRGSFMRPGSDRDNDIDDFAVVSALAREHMQKPSVIADSTPERLAVREEVLHHRLKRLTRDGC